MIHQRPRSPSSAAAARAAATRGKKKANKDARAANLTDCTIPLGGGETKTAQIFLAHLGHVQ